ncbi:MAG: hypothetical protein ABI669_15105 [Usitatibacter sp.]
MNPEEPVDNALALLRGEMQSVQAPAALENVLAARFRRQHRAPRPLLWWMPPLALAATVAVVSWMVRAPMPSAPATTPSTTRAVVDDGPFLALKPLERIALEPGSTVVATEFPRALLADWGLPVSPDRAGEPVRAEMLYSAGGEALAIRLIN